MLLPFFYTFSLCQGAKYAKYSPRTVTTCFRKNSVPAIVRISQASDVSTVGHICGTIKKSLSFYFSGVTKGHYACSSELWYQNYHCDLNLELGFYSPGNFFQSSEIANSSGRFKTEAKVHRDYFEEFQSSQEGNQFFLFTLFTCKEIKNCCLQRTTEFRGPQKNISTNIFNSTTRLTHSIRKVMQSPWI